MAASVIFIIGVALILFVIGMFCGYYRGYDNGLEDALETFEREVMEAYHNGK